MADTTVRMGPERPKAAFTLDSSRVFEYRLMVEGLFRREGPSKSRVTVLERDNAAQPLAAGIDPDTWDVEMVLRSGFHFQDSKELRRFLSLFGIADPLRETMLGTSRHEIGHWEYPKTRGFGCPYDKAAYYTSFIEPIFDELKRSMKFSEQFCKSLSQRIANAVTDVIDNYNVSRVLQSRRHPFLGQMLFWYLQGQESERYTKEYTLFVKLNLALFGNRHDRMLLKGFMEDGKEIGESVKRLKAAFTPGNIYSRGMWERLARAYAREALKHIENEEQFSLQYSAGDRSAGGEPGKQGGGKEEEGDGKKDGKGNASGEPPEFGEDLGKGDIEKIMMGRKPGQGIPFFIETSKALDAYYTGLAKSLPMKAVGKLPSAKMPFVPLLREPYDPELHDTSEACMNRLVVDAAGGRVVPSVVRSRLPVEFPVRREKRRLPDFMMALLDSSGSMMGWGDRSITPWGDRSYYHFGLLTFYGMLRFFELERILHKMGVSAAIFSDDTLAATGLEEVKKRILNPVSGGTSLDIRKVMAAMQGKEGAIFSMISDGEILNWDSVRDEFIALARRNQFFMIQIGRDSAASRDLKAAGLLVKNVNGPEDIVKLAIDLNVERYSAAIASKLEGEARKYGELR